MPMVTFVILLLAVATTGALPLAKVHVKFVSPPHTYEHGITTDGDRTVSQRSFVSIGRRSTAEVPKEFGRRLNSNNNHIVYGFIKPQDAESLWPIGVFLPPVDVNDLGFSSQESRHMTPDFSNGLGYHDPFLLTGDKAMMAVKYLYARELFYDDYPHEAAVLRNQEERIQNGLDSHTLRSLRTSSLFYRRA